MVIPYCTYSTGGQSRATVPEQVPFFGGGLEAVSSPPRPCSEVKVVDDVTKGVDKVIRGVGEISLVLPV